MNPNHRITILLALLIVSFTNLYGQKSKISNSQNVDNSIQLLKKIGLSEHIFQIITVKGDTIIVLKSHFSQNCKGRRVVKFKNLKIPFRLSINKATIDSVILINCHFENGITFDTCQINFLSAVNNIFEDVLFRSCKLPDDESDLTNNLFKKQVEFKPVKSKNSFLVFSNSFFFGPLDFKNDSLSGIAIVDTKLYYLVTFTNATTSQVIFMEHSVFRSTLMFYDCTINSSIYLAGNRFGKELTIDNSTITGDINIEEALLPNSIKIIKVKIPSQIDLSGSFPNPDFKKCFLYIDNESISKVIPNMSCELKFNNGISPEFRNETYKKILFNLKEKGYEELSKKFELDYKYFYFVNYKHQTYWYYIQKYWWNFGYDKYLVVFNTFLILLILSILIFATKIREYAENEYIVKTLSEKHTQNRSIKSRSVRFFADYTIALIFTANIFFRFGLKMEDMRFNNYVRSVVIIFIYLVGLICTAFIFNFIITSK